MKKKETTRKLFWCVQITYMQKSEDKVFQQLYHQWHAHCLNMKTIPFFRDYEETILLPSNPAEKNVTSTVSHLCTTCHKAFSCEAALKRHKKKARAHVFWSWFQQQRRI